MSKIENPVVLIHKRENSDTYAVAITSGSADFHDAVLMATMEPDMVGDGFDTWSKTGYYMATEIEELRRICAEAYQCVGVLSDMCGAFDDAGVIKLLDNLSQQKLVHSDVLPFSLPANSPVIPDGWALVPVEPTQQMVDAHISGVMTGGFAKGYREMLAAAPVNDVTAGKPLTITLPDTSSKAFWSGAGKSEVFHPETYKRWVKEAIERGCIIAGIAVRVK